MTLMPHCQWPCAAGSACYVVPGSGWQQYPPLAESRELPEGLRLLPERGLIWVHTPISRPFEPRVFNREAPS